MSGAGPGEREPVNARGRLSSGDRVRLKAVDEEDRLSGLTTDVVGVVHVELAVGGFLVSFPVAGGFVFSEEELERVD